MSRVTTAGSFPQFDRRFLESDEHFTVIGTGALGGKATGLAFIKNILEQHRPPGTFADIVVSIPTLTVVATDVFAEFMAHNRLYDVALSDTPDERIAHAFQRAELPPLIVGDLRALIARLHQPLAIRSSSLLEDALQHPFAGTYETKMVPNNQATADARFQRLVEAVKLVYASTFFRDAKCYMQAIGHDPAHERMAVIIQEVVGRRHNERFYPAVSGVLRTHNFYPCPPAQPEDGVVSLALGLGKTIVDGGACWSYSPRFPEHGPPVSSARELLRCTQARFWAVNMGPPPPYNPISETEYLVEADLSAAEYDDTLRRLASKYDGASDRLRLGTGGAGPRVLTFAPLLELPDVPLNPLLERLASVCKVALGADVEIEFAMTLDEPAGDAAERSCRHRFGFLQLRPMLVSSERIEVTDEELHGPSVLVSTARALGNGVLDGITDVIYVRPDNFEARHTRAIAGELMQRNAQLAAEGRSCVLIGFGRWGSSDPWLGTPVTWPQISAARVIVEATRPDMNVEPSQGTHFFHNLTSFRVQYFTVPHQGPHAIAWDWLARQSAVAQTELIRHVRLATPLRCKVDGRSGRGVILHGD